MNNPHITISRRIAVLGIVLAAVIVGTLWALALAMTSHDHACLELPDDVCHEGHPHGHDAIIGGALDADGKLAARITAVERALERAPDHGWRIWQAERQIAAVRGWADGSLTRLALRLAAVEQELEQLPDAIDEAAFAHLRESAPVILDYVRELVTGESTMPDGGTS